MPEFSDFRLVIDGEQREIVCWRRLAGRLQVGFVAGNDFLYLEPKPKDEALFLRMIRENGVLREQ